MNKETAITCVSTLTLGGGGGAGVTYYVKTKDFKEPEVQEVVQYKFSQSTLKSLNNRDEYFQRWMLLTLKFMCDKFHTKDNFSRSGENYLSDALEVKNTEKLIGFFKLNGVADGDKLNKAKEKIKEFLDSTDKENASGGLETRFCKDVRAVVMGNLNLFSEFNVDFTEKTSEFKSQAASDP